MAGQPTRVQVKHNQGSAVTSLVVTPSATTTGGNTLLVAVILDASMAGASNGILDSQGNDAFGVPKNKWNALGGPVNNNGVIIQWYACRASLAVTTVTAEFSASTNAMTA